jgi:hypothetical protein
MLPGTHKKITQCISTILNIENAMRGILLRSVTEPDSFIHRKGVRIPHHSPEALLEAMKRLQKAKYFWYKGSIVAMHELGFALHYLQDSVMPNNPELHHQIENKLEDVPIPKHIERYVEFADFQIPTQKVDILPIDEIPVNVPIPPISCDIQTIMWNACFVSACAMVDVLKVCTFDNVRTVEMKNLFTNLLLGKEYQIEEKVLYTRKELYKDYIA